MDGWIGSIIELNNGMKLSLVTSGRPEVAAAEPEDILSWELCSRALLGSKFGQLERWQLRYQCQLVTLAARLKVDQAQVANAHAHKVVDRLFSSKWAVSAPQA